MWCVCIDKESGDMFVMNRSERETMISVLLDLNQPIPSWVLSVKHTKEEADKWIKDIKAANDLIEKNL